VQVRQAARGVERHADSVPPEEGHTLGVAPLQALVDVTAPEELVDEEALRAAAREAHEDDEVRVPELAQHAHLLLEAAVGGHVEDLDGHVGAVGLRAAVHRAAGPVAEAAALVEVVGGPLQLLVGVLEAVLVQRHVKGDHHCGQKLTLSPEKDCRICNEP